MVTENSMHKMKIPDHRREFVTLKMSNATINEFAAIRRLFSIAPVGAA
jgi:hypothetical protein